LLDSDWWTARHALNELTSRRYYELLHATRKLEQSYRPADPLDHAMIAQIVFLLKRGHVHRQTDRQTERHN